MVRLVKLKEWTDLNPVWKRQRYVRPPSSRVFYTVSETQMCFTKNTCSIELNFLVYKLKRHNQFSTDLEDDQIDIDYNFAIGGDGYVYECRGWNLSPALPSQFRGPKGVQSLFIVFVGRFNIYPPSLKMFQAKDELLEYGRENGHLLNNYEEYNI